MVKNGKKKIFTNAIALYVRLAISTIVGIFTSRIILDTLGVADYGIYNIVGGVIVMANFLNASMAGATTRFITYDLGRVDLKSQKETFTVALLAHIIIALIVLVLAETIGLWFVNTQLDYPENRFVAVQWVYQTTILSMIVSITQVPYNASIIAHEKMGIYAYIEILNSILKLGIVYILYIVSADRLIIYSILVLIVSVFIAILYRVYCVRNFEETKACRHFNFEKFKAMLSFSGFDLYGNACVVVSNQFVNIVINQFFGILLNAASGIASMVNGIVASFSGNVVQAFKPQITKQYAVNNIHEMRYLIDNALKFSIFIMSCMSIPLIFEMDFIMKLWLKEVPKYAPDFCKIMLIGNLFRIVNNIILGGIHATGRIKMLSFLSGTLYLLQIPLMYLILHYVANPVIPYWVVVINMVIIVFVDVVILKHNIPQISIKEISYSITKTLIVIFLSVIPCYIVNSCLHSCFIRVVCTTLGYIIPALLIASVILLTKRERHNMILLLRKKIGLYGK